MIKLLDFYADWCGPCKMMDPILDEVLKEKDVVGKMTMEKIDVDQQTDIASKYGVMSIPTYVIERDGKEVGRLIGYVPKAEFKSKLMSYIGD